MVTSTAVAAVIPDSAESTFVDDIVGLGAPAHALAMQLLGNRDDAADAVQDAMENALRKAHSFDSARGTLRTWFLRTVRNRCIDQLRQRARAYRRTSDLDPGEIPAVDDPVVDTARDEATQTLLTHLRSLSREQREILVLRDYLSLGYAEIATILAIPQGTVMSRLHRARTSLSKKMNS